MAAKPQAIPVFADDSPEIRSYIEWYNRTNKVPHGEALQKVRELRYAAAMARQSA